MSKIDKNTIPENFTLGLAVWDFMPVLFFMLAMLVASVIMHSIVFTIGVLICFWAGTAKVIWKIIVALKRRNLWFLFIQMRIAMPLGFLLIIVGVVIGHASIEWGYYLSKLVAMPTGLFFALWIIGMIGMSICAVKLDSGNLRANMIEQGINSIAQLCLLVGMIFLWLTTPYAADENAINTLTQEHEEYRIESWDDGTICFVPKEEASSALIFYQGGAVENKSYAPLLGRLAEKNILCILVQMPYDYAVFDINAADKIQEKFPGVDSWYIGGHSLGGAMAADYVSKHSDDYKGLILLAAYSTKDLSDSNLDVLAIYGSNDEVLNRKSYDKYRDNLPTDFSEYIIDGGCHAYFGDYGKQKGDGEPTITVDRQQEMAVSQIVQFMWGRS